jgi:hypothetical protein
VILFYSTLWGQPLHAEGLPLPDGCLITTDRSRLEQATAVVFHLPELDQIKLPRKRSGQMWVAWSMECHLHRPWSTDRRFMALFDLTMTYEFNSDVPVPYIWTGILEPLQAPPGPKDPGLLAASFISSKANQSRRIEFTRELMEHIEVHSFGRLLQNRWLPEDAGPATKLGVLANYKFTLAFENAIAVDYVTEKFFDPLIAGSVPVYLGAPNIGGFAPGEHCFINAVDFESPKTLAKYLLALNQDDAAYGRYLEWKHKPLRTEFVQKAEALREPRPLVLCRKVLELRNARALPFETEAV